MLTTEQINDLHRLYWSDHWPIRKIERHLHMGWETIKKYLDMPAQTPAGRPRSSKLDAYKAVIAELLEKDPSASAAVIGQRLRPLGYTGGGSILRQYVHEVRPHLKPQRAFVRMEPKPGERFEADWGHFDSLDYQGDQRKLYAFALVDGHSRMQYLEFTHSQSFETFVRCHVHAFQKLNGIAREIWYDNLAGSQRHAIAVRRQSLLRAASIRRSPSHAEGRLQFGHHLRSGRRDRQLCAFMAAG